MPEIAEFVSRRPENRQQIRAWVKAFLSFSIHDTVRCTHTDDTGRPHQSQMDYVAGAFLGEFSSCVFMASRNAGKSYAAAITCLLDAHFKPGIKIAVAAFQRNQSDYIYEYLVEFLGTFEARIGYSVAKITKDEIAFHNGSSIRFYSGGKSQAGIKGFHPNILIVDEGDLFTQEQFDGIANALEAGGKFDRRFDVLSTNYTLSGEGVILKQIEKLDQWNKKKTEHLKPARVFRVCLLDILTQCDDRFQCDKCDLFKYCRGKAKEGTGFYKIESALETMRDSSLQTFESQMLLLRPSSEFTYFTNFSAANILDEIPYDPLRPTYFALDPGGSRCPHGAVLVQTDLPSKERGVVPTYYVVDEWMQMGAVEALLDNARAKYPRILDAQCYCDPAGNRKENMQGAMSYIGALRKAGFYPRSRQFKRRQGFELIHNLVQPASGKPKLFVAKKCTNLIKQIQAAEHEVKHGRPTPEPSDDITPDDVLDAFRTIVSWTCGTYAKHHGTNKILRHFAVR